MTVDAMTGEPGPEFVPATGVQALADLDAEIGRTADEIHDTLVREGLDEDQQSRLVQEAYIRLAAIRARSVAELDQAFARLGPLH
jgi:hypothetical protein